MSTTDTHRMSLVDKGSSFVFQVMDRWGHNFASSTNTTLGGEVTGRRIVSGRSAKKSELGSGQERERVVGRRSHSFIFGSITIILYFIIMMYS